MLYDFICMVFKVDWNEFIELEIGIVDIIEGGRGFMDWEGFLGDCRDVGRFLFFDYSGYKGEYIGKNLLRFIFKICVFYYMFVKLRKF